MRIILLGPPGIGKGTQGKMLEDALGVPHISTGDILREVVKKRSYLARNVAKYLERGELVPDRIVAEIIKNRLKKRDTSSGFILDGFPRNIPQAKILDNLLKEKRLSLDRVIYLYTKEEVLIKRLSGRRVCLKCQAIFHLRNCPPKEDSICDFCGGELVLREDDREETVKRRFRVYFKEIRSLIDHYSRKKLLVRVSANGDREKVFRRIMTKINS